MRRLPCRAATLSLCALALAAGGPTPRRLAAQPSAADTAQLRRTLAAAFGGELEIVRHELSSGISERSGTFWLVHARPVRSGDYRLKYRYEYRDHAHPENPLYTHVEHESSVRVGEWGCWRRREIKDLCLGDTIILPFVVNDYAGHTFSFTRLPSGAAARSTEAADAPAGRDTSRFLRYVGTQRSEMLHRNGGSTITYHAELEAVRPGRFNVALRPPSHAGITAPVVESGSVPVIVVARGAPVTVLLEHERVVGRNEKTGSGSTRDNQYLTTLLLLQPGDRISLPTWGHPRDDALARVPTADEEGPTVTLFPFRLDPADRFNGWLAGHLPRSGAR